MSLALHLKQAGEAALDFVLPPRCIATGETVERQGMLCSSAWAGLTFLSDPQCAACGHPFEFEAQTGALCGACLSDPPPFARARAALRYDEGCRDMILGFKHGDKLHAVQAFTPWLERAGAGAEMLPRADALVPVPLHRWRLLARRYNQAALLAAALSRACGVPWLPDALVRRKPTETQGHKRSAARARNVRAAFAVPDPRAVAGKSIVLVDDVYTTGATARECARALLRAGASSVSVLALARVVK